MSAVWPYFAAIVPTILVAILFYFLIKGMMEGDRRERLAQSRFEAEEDRQRATAAGSEPTRSAAPADDTGDRTDEGPRNSTTDS